MGQKRLWALLTHFFTSQAKPSRFCLALRRSRASSPKERADTPGNFTGQPGTVPPPLKPSPTGGRRWRVAPDGGSTSSPKGSQGLKPIAKVLGIMRKLSAVLLALPLRKDFHPLSQSGKMSRSAFKIIPHKKAAAQPLCSSCQALTTPHNFRLTASAPLRRLRHGRVQRVAKMLDKTSSIICAFGLAAAAPRSPYRHLELCGIALNILRLQQIRC